MPVGKITEGNNIAYGRTGIVYKDGLEFVFSLEDILLNDEKIKFIERTDTLPVTNLEELNQITRSNTFQLNSSSELYFTSYYVTVNPEFADSVLNDTDYVHFKLELVNADNDQVIGTYDDIVYNFASIYDYENANYQVNCEGIEEDNYYLRLVTDLNFNASFNIANLQNDAGLLGKKTFETVSYKGNDIPETYDLAQNYPNPFNPSTVIKYQLPKAGNVTLKIYDVLGREVKTLVDEFENEGRYEVNFNASRLASGVYIYRITAGDFISSKKMLLLK